MRVCPLFFSSTANLEEFVCRPDRCAWAYKGGCAIAAIACCLESMVDRQTEEEDDG